MRAVFLISDDRWSASARAFVLAAGGLKARGHDVLVVCDSGCPAAARSADAGIEMVSFRPQGSNAGAAWQLRGVLRDRAGTVFVHTERELLVASSALRLGRAGATLVRRVPPFTGVAGVTGGFASRLASRFAAPRVLDAPVGVDVGAIDRVSTTTRASLGVPLTGRLVVCVQDGTTNGARIALRTLALLAPRHPDLRLAVIGPGAMDDLRMQGSALGVNHLVSYVGSVADELSLMRSAHIGWVAASGDTGAFAFLDFMALGIPVLAARTPMSEHFIVDGITGTLLDPAADGAITSAAVAALLGNDSVRGPMGSAARARVLREFPIDAMIAGFEGAMAGASSRPQLAS